MIIEDLLAGRTDSSLNATIEHKCMTASDKRPVNSYYGCAGWGRVPPFTASMDFPNAADRGRRDDRQSSPPIKRCDASLAAAGLQNVGVLAYMGT